MTREKNSTWLIFNTLQMPTIFASEQQSVHYDLMR